MSLYDMPPVLTGIKEVDACYKIAQKMRAFFLSKIDEMEKEIFTDTATGDGLKRKETMLGITSLPSDTVEERRFRIKIAETIISCLNEENLQRLVLFIAGEEAEFSVDKAEKVVTIRCPIANEKMLEILKTTVREYIPADMALDISLLFARWEHIKGLHWGEINCTWGELKRSV